MHARCPVTAKLAGKPQNENPKTVTPQLFVHMTHIHQHSIAMGTKAGKHQLNTGTIDTTSGQMPTPNICKFYFKIDGCQGGQGIHIRSKYSIFLFKKQCNHVKQRCDYCYKLCAVQLLNHNSHDVKIVPLRIHCRNFTKIHSTFQKLLRS